MNKAMEIVMRPKPLELSEIKPGMIVYTEPDLGGWWDDEAEWEEEIAQWIAEKDATAYVVIEVKGELYLAQLRDDCPGKRDGLYVDISCRITDGQTFYRTEREAEWAALLEGEEDAKNKLRYCAKLRAAIQSSSS